MSSLVCLFWIHLFLDTYRTLLTIPPVCVCARVCVYVCVQTSARARVCVDGHTTNMSKQIDMLIFPKSFLLCLFWDSDSFEILQT